MITKSLLKAKTKSSRIFQLDIDSFENKFNRADLNFYGVDHSGYSYEARIFFNNPKATAKRLRPPEMAMPAVSTCSVMAVALAVLATAISKSNAARLITGEHIHSCQPSRKSSLPTDCVQYASAVRS